MSTANTGQAPDVVKVRLSGEPDDVSAMAEILTYIEPIEVLSESGPRPNRREPGKRVYLTVRVRGGAQGWDALIGKAASACPACGIAWAHHELSAALCPASNQEEGGR
jgi:hypothetical protein